MRYTRLKSKHKVIVFHLPNNQSYCYRGISGVRFYQMSVYQRQVKPTRDRRALVIDAAPMPAYNAINPDLKPSEHLRRNIRMAAIIISSMVIFMYASIKVLEHMWSRRDQAIRYAAQTKLATELGPDAGATTGETDRTIPAGPSSAMTPARSATPTATDPSERAETAFRWGKVLEDAGEQLGALAHYEEALALNPSHLRALSAAGGIHLQTAHFDRALEYFALARTLAPEDPILLNQYARALTYSGREAEAIAIFEDLLATHPEFYQAHLYRGYALLQLRETVPAREALETYIAAQPSDAMALGIMATLEVAEGNREAALVHLDRAIVLQPDWSKPYLDAASIAAVLEQPSRAAAYLEAALTCTSPAEVYQYYSSPAFRNLRISDEGRILERTIADHARRWIR